MPFYTFKCPSCNKEQEILQSITSANPVCERCIKASCGLHIPTMERVVGKEKLIMMDPVMGGEDFAIFANEVPGVYFRLGVVKPGTTSGWIHTPKFRADDSSLEVGAYLRLMNSSVRVEAEFSINNLSGQVGG